MNPRSQDNEGGAYGGRKVDNSEKKGTCGNPERRNMPEQNRGTSETGPSAIAYLGKDMLALLATSSRSLLHPTTTVLNCASLVLP